jgi:hypothetical protein
MSTLFADLHFIHFGQTFRQMDTAFQPRQMCDIDRTLHGDIVGFGNLIFWVS